MEKKPLTTHFSGGEEHWDAFVQKNGGGFLQSWGWSRFQEAVGRNVYRFRIGRAGSDQEEYGGDKTVVQFTMIEHDLPFGFKYSYVPRGPVMPADERAELSNERLETFMAAIRDAMSRQGHVFGRVEFPWGEGGPVGSESLTSYGFEQVGEMQPKHTSIVDLEPSEEDLMKAMHSKTRYNVRVAERHGVKIRKACRDNAHLFGHDMDVFWRLMGETTSRDGFSSHGSSYYQKMMDVMSPMKKIGVVCRLHFAEYQGQAIGAAITIEYGDTVTYLHGASSAQHRKVMAPTLLHWELIRQAKADGFKHYDFWGIAPPDQPKHRWAGITRFKTGFGGRPESYLGAWELPERHALYKAYRFAKKLRA